MPKPAPRKPFAPDKIQTSDMADVRAARALEFIAHYLERIDSHVEMIAICLDRQDTSLETLLAGYSPKKKKK
jgi:hypothetical protein